MIRFALLLALASVVGTSVAQDRFALVIGNGKYAGAAALANPTNDAAAVAAALQKLDFKVTKQTDVDLEAMEDAVTEFCKSLNKKSVALVFYAGHGLQVRGENFLLPLGADVKEEAQVKRKCYPLDEVLTSLDSSNAALKIVILDSCRDNPLTRSWKRSSESGLASIGRIPNGTIIAFSTAPGETALDGRETTSPFTKHLVASLDRRPAEGLELIQALRATGQAVSKEIGQRPWLNFDTSLDDFYLWRDVNASVASVPKHIPKPTSQPMPTPPEKPLPLPKGWKRIDHPHDSKFESAENSIGMKFVVVPPGEFLMGSPEDDRDADADEKPRHRVRISRSTYFGMHEVTLGQFLNFYHDAKYKTDAEKYGEGGGYDGKNGGFKKSSEFVPWTTGFKQTNDHPVVNVSWNDAQAFCKWLNEKEGQPYRLPTEAEWEYACRGGTETKYWSGDNPEPLAKVGNVADGTAKENISDWSTIVAKDGFYFQAPVGSFRPNPFGLYDMHGNVWEWCEDWYGDEYGLRSGVVTNPKGPIGSEQTDRVIRGGGWDVNFKNVRSANRSRFAPDKLNYNVGFRVVLPITE